MLRCLLLVALFLLFAGHSVSIAYDTTTHRSLGEAAASHSSLDAVLREQLGMVRGRETALRWGPLTLSVGEWLGHGAREEDLPLKRVLNHFHDPLRPWRDAGLSVIAQLGDSSVLWSQRESQAPGGTWTWAGARRAFLEALTSPTAEAREQRLAQTLDTLGHLTHLVQDASVPAHVRNDPHPSIPLLGTLLPLNPDWYEDWVEARRTRGDAIFDELLALPPKRPLRLVLQSIDPDAPVGIAGLIDTDQLGPDGPAPAVFGPPSVGIAEFTSANFLSRDTIFRGAPARPRLEDLGPGFFEEERQAFRRYFPKVVPGTAAVEIGHFVAEAVLTEHLRRLTANVPPTVLWHLDHRVHEAYARELVPRAIGYSAELIDYFFRGRLDVDLTLDPSDPGRVQLSGINGSPEPLFEGDLTLYADTVAGERVRAASVDPIPVIGVAAGAPLVPARFEPPADAERFIAVYQGTLGLERKRDGFAGAIVGRVLGGTRVEEVFADGDRWRLRTPVGVFELPLPTDVYEDVRWGDADDVLVARTPLGLDPPGLVAAYAIVRRPGSSEPILAGAPPVVVLEPRAAAPLSFASAPLVTTIALEQTIDHRQQIGRWGVELDTRWTPGINVYETVAVTHTPIAFETLHQQTVRFTDTIPIRLDPEHNLDLGSTDRPYFWDLVEVAADREGRLLGLAAIVLTRPEVAPVGIPWLRLDAEARPFVARSLTVEASFPDDATTIWVVVDLGSGVIVASTAEPVVTIASRRASEAPPWDGEGFGPLSPGIYRRSVTRYEGGPLAGRVESVWEAIDPAPRTDPGALLAHVDVVTGEQTLDVAGWFQPEIREALRSASLGDFVASEVQRSTQRWNYDCLISPCASDGDHAGFAVETRRGGVPRPPAQLVDARRVRPAPAGERLVLLGDAFHEAPRPVGSVVAWDAGARLAREAFRVPASFHGLGPQASTSAVLLAYRPQVGARGTFVVPLEAGGIPQFFANDDLPVDFALVAPDRLYNVRDFRFYRGEPPRQATPLPARLSPAPGNPIGDYHAIRLP